jgi:MFS family permease
MTSETLDIREGPIRFALCWVRRVPRGEFCSIAFATILFNCGISVIMFLYNLFLLDLGHREQSMGMLTSAMVLGGMVGTIPMGALAGRFGQRRVLAMSLLLSASAFALRVCVLWYPVELLSSFLAGVMLCGWMVCVSPAVAGAVEEEKHPFAFSFLFSVAIATNSIGGIIGGWGRRGASIWLCALSALRSLRPMPSESLYCSDVRLWPVPHGRPCG